MRAEDSKLTDWQTKRLKNENFITWAFASFYILRTLVMDLGYTFFVAKYYIDVNSSSRDELNIENFPFGENSPLSLVIYTLDFFICMILLVLFYMYAKKASDDEEKLKRYYLISIGRHQFLTNDGEPDDTEEGDENKNYGRGGLAGLHLNHKKHELSNESFIKMQN